MSNRNNSSRAPRDFQQRDKTILAQMADLIVNGEARSPGEAMTMLAAQHGIVPADRTRLYRRLKRERPNVFAAAHQRREARLASMHAEPRRSVYDDLARAFAGLTPNLGMLGAFDPGFAKLGFEQHQAALGFAKIAFPDYDAIVGIGKRMRVAINPATVNHLMATTEQARKIAQMCTFKLPEGLAPQFSGAWHNLTPPRQRR